MTSPTPIFPKTILSPPIKIVPADTTTKKTILTVGVDGARIDGIFVTSTDTSARDLQFFHTIGGVDYLFGTLSIPANSGNTNALPTINVFQQNQFLCLNLDANGNKETRFAAGTILKVASLTTITAAKEIAVWASEGDY